VPPGQLQGGGSSQFGVDPSGRQSDPVNSRTGAFESRVSDVRLPGPGLGFSFDRSYDSGRADEPPGPLGPGWTHAYAARLELSSGRGRDDALVELRTGAGQRIRFAFQETVYVAGPGVRASLRKVGEGYEVVGHDQVRLRFDGDGRLLAIEDRNGNRQALRYDGGRLSAIEDAAGRRVELAYGSGGRLERLGCPTGDRSAIATTARGA
jgi:YD repeat-containing protein